MGYGASIQEGVILALGYFIYPLSLPVIIWPSAWYVSECFTGPTVSLSDLGQALSVVKRTDRMEQLSVISIPVWDHGRTSTPCSCDSASNLISARVRLTKAICSAASHISCSSLISKSCVGIGVSLMSRQGIHGSGPSPSCLKGGA